MEATLSHHSEASPFRVHRAILRLVKIPLVEPFRISNGSVAEKESIIVELHAENVVGYGEASPMSGSFYSGETPETTWSALANDLIPDLLSRDVQSPVSYAELLHAYRRESFARAGIEGAVWDVCARRLNTTIGSLLAPAAPPSDGSDVARRPIPSGLAVGIYDTVDELLDRVDRFMADGYQRLKIKIMPGWDIEPLTAIRNCYPNMPLMVDANAAYRWPEHCEVLLMLDNFHLMMIEQPLAADALKDMAEMSRVVRTPICVDESAENIEVLEEIIRLRAASIVNIKVQRVGGLWNAKRMHDRAHQAGLACWLGTMPELGIASAQALEIASLPGFVYPTDIEASSRWFVDDIVEPLIHVDSVGCIDTSSTYVIDRAKLERYTCEILEFTA